MGRFEISAESSYGRLGEIKTPNGPVLTPALFPILNFIGGTTINSGGIHRYTREYIIENDEAQAAMMQAMSFLDFGLSSKGLNDWRKDTLRNHYEERLDLPPIFVDSGGFKLMNSQAFGEHPEAGGDRNDWGVYTNSRSILELQRDFGADIIATLDYPIVEGLAEEEKRERLDDSINNAIECLELLEDDIFSDYDPVVYAAIHGHEYDSIYWYVNELLNRSKEFTRSFQGVAIGSLVPLRTKLDTLVNIVQGAKQALVDNGRDDLALHVFGVGGKLLPILAMLGVDSFDISTHFQAARSKNYFMPETWERYEVGQLDGMLPCDCTACKSVEYDTMVEVLYSDKSYQKIQGHWKSEFYARIAQHNFWIFNKEMNKIREAIQTDSLLEHVANFASTHNEAKEALKFAQKRDVELKTKVREIAGNSMVYEGKAKSGNKGGSSLSTSNSEDADVSFNLGPNSFNIQSQTNYQIGDNESVLMFLPCSKKKPYRESRTQRTVLEKLDGHRNKIHKVTVSGFYGPVPEQFEDHEPVQKYDYVLVAQDKEQIDIIVDRLVDYLTKYGDEFDHIYAYVTTQPYRDVIQRAFSNYPGETNIYPVEPKYHKLTEYFKSKNIKELVSAIQGAYMD